MEKMLITTNEQIAPKASGVQTWEFLESELRLIAHAEFARANAIRIRKGIPDS
jgi:hypothetical protein